MKNVYEMLNLMDGKLDKIDERLNTMDVRLAKYNAELEFHVARTNQIEDDLFPIAKHVTQINAVMKFSVWAIGVFVAILALYLGAK